MTICRYVILAVLVISPSLILADEDTHSWEEPSRGEGLGRLRERAIRGAAANLRTTVQARRTPGELARRDDQAVAELARQRNLSVDASDGRRYRIVAPESGRVIGELDRAESGSVSSSVGTPDGAHARFGKSLDAISKNRSALERLSAAMNEKGNVEVLQTGLDSYRVTRKYDMPGSTPSTFDLKNTGISDITKQENFNQLRTAILRQETVEDAKK